MSQEIQLRSPDVVPDLANPFAGQDAALPPTPLQKIHRLLQRRYGWCIALAAVLGAAGAVGGYKARQPVYQSTGMVQIRVTVPPIMKSIDSNPNVAAAYEPFVQSQVALIQSQRVVEKALGADAFKRLGRDMGTDEAIPKFMKKLVVQQIPRSELISVAFEDPEPAATRVVVTELLKAYDDIRREYEKALDEVRNSTLRRRRDLLMLDLANRRDDIQKIADRYGTDDLRPLYQAEVNEYLRWTFAVNDLVREQPRPDDPGSIAAVYARLNDPAQRKTMTNEEVAFYDPLVRQLLREVEAVQAESPRYDKLLDSHPRKKEYLDLLKARQATVQNYADVWRNQVGGTELPQPSRAMTFGRTKKELDELRQKYAEFRDNAERKARETGQTMLRLERLRKEEKDLQDQFAQVNSRLSEVELESQNQPRIAIQWPSERALMIRDVRLQLAGAGGVFGIGLGFGLVLLIALMDSRFRSVDDARNHISRLALLGVLPSLPEDLADPEQAAIASHCVHQIRTLLQIGPNAGRHVFTITSPAAGTGKTSLTLSLGVSFAAASSRVLLIDCDMMGRGLTARVDAIIRRKIGQIFLQRGLVTQAQLDGALEAAQAAGRKLGEVLVERGHVTAADVQQALTLQEQMPVGLLDALSGERLDQCVAPTGIQGLSILPVGAAQPADASKLSLAALRGLVDRARQQYDIVLIDAGPVPASLEASVASAASDGVVLIVSRGEQRPMAERSLAHLREIGVAVAGLVFNRAEQRDAAAMGVPGRFSGGAAAPAKFGPVALAVARPQAAEDKSRS